MLGWIGISVLMLWLVGTLIALKFEKFAFEVGDLVIAKNFQSLVIHHLGGGDPWKVIHRYKWLFLLNRYVLEGVFINGQHGRRREFEGIMLKVPPALCRR